MKEQSVAKIWGVSEVVPSATPPVDQEKPEALHTWHFEDLVQANRMATFFEGLSMIMRVNRETITVDLIGFEEDDT